MQHLKDMNSVSLSHSLLRYSRYMVQILVLAIFITEHQNIKFSDIMGPVTRA